MQILNQQGKGRVFVVLFEAPELSYASMAEQTFLNLSQNNNVYLITSPKIEATNWQELTGKFLSLIKDNKIRQLSVVAFGAATILAQNLALLDMKLVRTLVLIDASMRPHATKLTRLIDWLEHFLPLGLPLRSNSLDFDSQPYLQRLRCPTLLALSNTASELQISNAHTMRTRLPTAWSYRLPVEESVLALSNLVLDFEKVLARCPQ